MSTLNPMVPPPKLVPPPTLRQRTVPASTTPQARPQARSVSVQNPTYSPTTQPSIRSRENAVVNRFSDTSKATRILLMNAGLILIMAIIYTIWLWVQPEAWNTPLGEGEEFSVFSKLINGLYVSIVTHSTVGFGDFFPLSVPAKILVMIHGMMVFYINLFLGLS
jgi:hypothetical protein